MISPSSFSPEIQNPFSLVHVGALGIERMPEQRIPNARRRCLAVATPDQPLEIGAQPQMDAHVARRPVAGEHKAAEQPRRAMLDGQRIGQPQIIRWDDIRKIEGHGNPPGGKRRVCVLATSAGGRVFLGERLATAISRLSLKLVSNSVNRAALCYRG